MGILEQALKEVHKYGWTIEALSIASEKNGYPGVSHGMFPRGPIDLAQYFVDKVNKDLAEKVSKMEIKK